ncbi:hypothetical protein OPQ81_006766 [Rhizoctonia solani]|nr:hypothetical protein OPQ81_006766 [Rhizoctonia solani]
MKSPVTDLGTRTFLKELGTTKEQSVLRDIVVYTRIDFGFVTWAPERQKNFRGYQGKAMKNPTATEYVAQ